jgi:hypothetical protein
MDASLQPYCFISCIIHPHPSLFNSMTRFLFNFVFSIALLLPITSFADWTEFHADEEITYYVNPESRKEMKNPRISILRDFKTPTQNGDQSARLMYEADCENKKLKLSNGIYLKKSMGNGEVSGMINSNGWQDPSTRVVLNKIFNLLCTGQAQ